MHAWKKMILGTVGCMGEVCPSVVGALASKEQCEVGTVLQQGGQEFFQKPSDSPGWQE